MEGGAYILPAQGGERAFFAQLFPIIFGYFDELEYAGILTLHTLLPVLLIQV